LELSKLKGGPGTKDKDGLELGKNPIEPEFRLLELDLWETTGGKR
jgi:hypothetical protein